MAVNESVYGLKENWVIRNITGNNYGANVSGDEKLKIANFLNTTGLTPSSDDRLGCCLGNAIYKMINNPSWTINGTDGIFDKSIVFTAMSGRHCPFTTLRFITNQRPDTATDNYYPITELDSQTIDIVNWSLSTDDLDVDYGNNVKSLVLYKADASSQEPNANKNYNIRWSPSPDFGTLSSTYNQFYTVSYSGRNRTTFVTQLPCRRFVLVPYITCSTDTDSSVSTVDLSTYINTTKATKPRIISISVGVYAISANSDIASPSNQRVLGSNYGLIIHHTLDGLNGFYCDTPNSTNKTLIDNNYFVPVCRTSPYFPIGGLINSGHGTNQKPSGIDGVNASESNKFNTYIVVNCGDLSWNMWSGDGDGLTGKGEYLYCDASSYTDEQIIESVRHAVACFGMFFADSEDNARNKALDDSGIFLGTLVDGIGYGNYTEGILNRDQPQYNWSNMGESPYDPSEPPTPPAVDPNTYGVGMHTNAPWMSSPNRLYSINSTWISSIVSLYNSLWKCYYDNNVGMEEGQTPPTEFNFNEFLTVSPIDTIVSLKLFPYDTKSSSTNVGIRLGKYATGVNAYNALLYNVLDFGTVDIYPYFGDNWKDRETKYTLYAPFCGTLELDPAFYMGHTVGLEYWIDQVTGACTAALYITDNDNAKVYGDTVSGICAVDVPITGLDQATIQSQIFNANQQLKNANVNAASGLANAAMGIVASAALGNAVGAATAAISGISNLIKNTDAVEAASYNLQHNKMSPRMIGAASPLCSMLGDWIPRIIVSIPIDPLSDAEQQQFSETKGYSCIIPDKIGNHSGYVQAVNLKIVPPEAAAAAPTEEEVELIKSLVASGIYI